MFRERDRGRGRGQMIQSEQYKTIMPMKSL